MTKPASLMAAVIAGTGLRQNVTSNDSPALVQTSVTCLTAK
jgi:hypothetical protein